MRAYLYQLASHGIMHQSQPKYPAHSWRFFHRPKETWEAMYLDCAQATQSIEFEQYILENDPLGRRFMELFITKAKQGLLVFLIFDTFGSALLRRSILVNELRQNGGHVHFYNPLAGWMMFTPWRWFPRTHSKTMLIDSSVAYTGGVCMAERMSDWRDTHLRVTGPVTQQVRHAFDDLQRRIMRRKSTVVIAPPASDTFSYVVNRPWQERRDVYRQLVKAISEAKNHIYITTAFFIPSRRFLKLLNQAYRRGVQIKIIVPEHSDLPLADWLRLSYTQHFLEAGLTIYHYQETVLHSKTAIIDDRWATVGSTNFDVISFFHNREANIVTTEPQAIDELHQRFLSDIKLCREWTLEEWKKIPIWKKAAGYAARGIKVFFG